MNNFLLFIGGLLVALLCAALAVPHFIDWNSYRATFETEASRLLGREIRVGGNVNLRLLPSPYVGFEKVRVADASGRFVEPLFRADQFTMWLSAPALLRGAFEANQIELTKPRLRLKISDDGGLLLQRQRQTQAQPSRGFVGARRVFLPTALVPRDIALDAVKIEQGELEVVSAQGQRLISLSNVNGQLSAPTLSGPYTFTGSILAAGKAHDVRLRTAAPDEAGAVALKGSFRDPGDGGLKLDFAGLLADLTGKPKLTGDLTGRLPFGAFSLSPGKTLQRARFASLTSRVDADLSQLRLQKILLTIDEGARPQRITGVLRKSWSGDGGFDARFKAPWLDLDQALLAQRSTAPPSEVAFAALTRLSAQLPDVGTVTTALDIEQAKFGGETISGLSLRLAQNEGELTVKRLAVRLPGASAIDLNGYVSGDPAKPSFTGQARLRGRSLQALSRWATGNAAFKVPASLHGFFSLTGKLEAGIGWLRAHQLDGVLGGTRGQGAVSWGWQGKRQLDVTIDAAHLDADRHVPGGLRLATLLKALDTASLPGAKGQNAGQKGQAATKPQATATAANASLRPPISRTINLRFGRVVSSGQTFHDVIAKLALGEGRIDVERLSLRDGDRLAVDVVGSIDRHTALPRGRLRGTVQATDAQALATLQMLFDVPAALRPDEARQTAVLPLNLTADMTLAGGRVPKSTPGFKVIGQRVRVLSAAPLRLVLDGSLGRVGVRVDATVNAHPFAWRMAPVDLTATVRGPRADALMAMLGLPGSRPGADALKGQGSGVLRVHAAGRPIKGMLTRMVLASKPATATFKGRVTLRDVTPSDATAGSTRRLADLIDFQGDSAVDLRDTRLLVALAKLPSGPLGANLPSQGRFTVVKARDRLALSAIDLNLRGNRVRGDLTIERDGSRRRIKGALQARQATLNGLLAALTQPQDATATRTRTRSGTDTGAAEPQSTATSIWSDQPFSFEAIKDLRGRIKLAANRFMLPSGLALDDARLTLDFRGDQVRLSRASARAAGGKVSGQITLARARAGVRASGTLSLSNLALSRLLQAAAPTDAVGQTIATGTSTLRLRFNGQALSARGLMPVLKGKGYVQLGSVAIRHFAPDAVERAADDAIQQPERDRSNALRDGIAALMAQGRLNLGARRLPLTLADGDLTAGRLTIVTPKGRITADTRLDLDMFEVTSTWQVTSAPGRNEATGKALTALPPVTVKLQGALSALGSIEPRYNVAALASELEMRKVERDLERLELIKQRDEEAARRAQEQAPVQPSPGDAQAPGGRPPRASTQGVEPDAKPGVRGGTGQPPAQAAPTSRQPSARTRQPTQDQGRRLRAPAPPALASPRKAHPPATRHATLPTSVVPKPATPSAASRLKQPAPAGRAARAFEPNAPPAVTPAPVPKPLSKPLATSTTTAPTSSARPAGTGSRRPAPTAAAARAVRPVPGDVDTLPMARGGVLPPPDEPARSGRDGGPALPSQTATVAAPPLPPSVVPEGEAKTTKPLPQRRAVTLTPPAAAALTTPKPVTPEPPKPRKALKLRDLIPPKPTVAKRPKAKPPGKPSKPKRRGRPARPKPADDWRRTMFYPNNR
ncbi:MAG: AsmA family protein [Pseudomonadota bacterium]